MTQSLDMGKGSSRLHVQQFFPEKQLQHYSECTYFTEQEINKLYFIFSSLSPEKFSYMGNTVGDAEVRLTFEELQSLNQLKECPFSQRLCEVFSTGDRGINFEDFLDMMSVFSRRAPWNLKAAYAFKIFDFNNDCLIDTEDIRVAINCITGKVIQIIIIYHLDTAALV